jgi:putative ABC transport system substrate-binding protein
MIRRRDFLGLAGAVGAAAWPRAARAQRASMPVIGFFNGQSQAAFLDQLASFKTGLGAGGFEEGRNVAIEYRWGNGDAATFVDLVADLVRRRVTLLTLSGANAAVYQTAITIGIPVVGTFGRDPRRDGLVDSLSRPSGNVTGVNFGAFELEGKRVALLRDVVPSAKTLGILARSGAATPAAEDQIRDAQAAASALGLATRVLRTGAADEVDAALATLVNNPVDVLLVAASPFFNGLRDRILGAVVALRLPAIFEWREFATGGGLMSYGTNLADGYRQLGAYTAEILKGRAPSDLPVVQSSTFDLVINLKTAKALGLTVPPTMLAIATEVIE